MRLIILLVVLLHSIIINGQTLAFINHNDEPISDVYVEFLDIQGNQKYISDSDGVINLSDKIFDNYKRLKVRISHISYLNIQAYISSEDTVIVLEKENIILDQVFVTAQINPINNSDVIQKATLINREQIESQGANSLKELLDKQLNMRISNDNVLGSSISIQGVSGQNIKILIDGVPVIGRLDGNIDLSQINLNNIERVEVIEGPLSVNFGSDALAGAINLISITDQKDNFSSNYNLYYESAGHYNADLALSYKLEENIFSFNGGRNYFDGWSKDENFQLLPTAQLADTNRVKLWNPKEQYFGKLQFFTKSKKYISRFYYESFYEKITNLGFPRLPYYETAFDDYYYTRRNNLGIDFTFNFNKEEKIKVLSSYNKYNRVKNTYFKDLTTLQELLTYSTDDQDTSDFSLFMNNIVFSSIKLPNFNYQLGFDSKIENVKGARITHDSRSLGDHALYFSSEWKPINSFVLRPALRLSYNSKFKVPLIPSLNALMSHNNLKFRCSIAKGFRSPTLKELFFEFVDVNHNIVGNRDLDAETSNNYQFSIDYDNKHNSFKYAVGTKFFYNDINNLISLAQSPSSTEYSYFNIGKYKTLGVSNRCSFSDDNLTLTIGSSHIGRHNNLSEEEDVIQFSYSHSFRSSLLYSFNKYNLSLAAFYKFTGKLPGFYKDSNDDIVESYLDSYNLLDLVLSKGIFSNKMKLKIGIKNLFDVQDVTSFLSTGIHSSSSNSQSIGYGRTFFTSLNLNL